VIKLAVTSGGDPVEYSIALEYKRPNEGLHGILTAIGQAHAYIRKGYSGAVMVIPPNYPGLAQTGPYVNDVLAQTSRCDSIGVFTYNQPDMSSVQPFASKLTLHRSFQIDRATPVETRRTSSRDETQWAHVREGSTDPDAFFRYLQTVKLLGGGEIETFKPDIPNDLSDAVRRVRADNDPEKYISNCPNDSLPDIAWRHFWFKYVLHKDALPGWYISESGEFMPNVEPSKILRSDNNGLKLFFGGRANSIKNKLATQLNSRHKSQTIAEEELVTNYSKRAHSYREDIDSGCEHLGFVDGEGRLTENGYRFVDACERFGNPNTGLPRAIFLNALLSEGALGAFLHYIYRLSEEKFRTDPFAFADIRPDAGRTHFVQDEYLTWLEEEMQHTLHVIRKVSLRGGVARRPFQAELAVLRSLGIVEKEFRMGVGLVINWPEFQDALSFSG
jgi:hypothetical protein